MSSQLGAPLLPPTEKPTVGDSISTPLRVGKLLLLVFFFWLLWIPPFFKWMFNTGSSELDTLRQAGQLTRWQGFGLSSLQIQNLRTCHENGITFDATILPVILSAPFEILPDAFHRPEQQFYSATHPHLNPGERIAQDSLSGAYLPEDRRSLNRQPPAPPSEEKMMSALVKFGINTASQAHIFAELYPYYYDTDGFIDPKLTAMFSSTLTSPQIAFLQSGFAHDVLRFSNANLDQVLALRTKVSVDQLKSYEDQGSGVKEVVVEILRVDPDFNFTQPKFKDLVWLCDICIPKSSSSEEKQASDASTKSRSWHVDEVADIFLNETESQFDEFNRKWNAGRVGMDIMLTLFNDPNGENNLERWSALGLAFHSSSPQYSSKSVSAEQGMVLSALAIEDTPLPEAKLVQAQFGVVQGIVKPFSQLHYTFNQLWLFSLYDTPYANLNLVAQFNEGQLFKSGAVTLEALVLCPKALTQSDLESIARGATKLSSITAEPTSPPMRLIDLAGKQQREQAKQIELQKRIEARKERREKRQFKIKR